MQRDLHQAAEHPGHNLRYAGNRGGIEHTVAQPPQLGVQIGPGPALAAALLDGRGQRLQHPLQPLGVG